MKSARALLLGVEDAGLERHRLPWEKYTEQPTLGTDRKLKKTKPQQEKHISSIKDRVLGSISVKSYVT